jgi:hypothetical protein
MLTHFANASSKGLVILPMYPDYKIFLIPLSFQVRSRRLAQYLARPRRHYRPWQAAGRKKSEGTDVLAFKVRLKMRRRPTYVSTRLTGPLPDQNVPAYLARYNRGLDEVAAFVEQVTLV